MLIYGIALYAISPVARAMAQHWLKGLRARMLWGRKT
jgi:hypothetical protein